MELEGYEKEKLTIDLVRANRIALGWFLPIALGYAVPFVLIWRDRMDLKAEASGLFSGWHSFAIFLVVLVLGIVVQELVHGLAWSVFAKRGFRSMRFGVMWKLLTPYCHCKEPLRVKHYMLGAIAPAIVLGLVPGVAAIITGSKGLLAFGIIFTIVAMGDFLIIQRIYKEPADAMVLDHPSEAGCYIFRPDPGSE